MTEALRKIFNLLAIGGQKKLYWLFVAVIFMSMLDLVGVASIFPFLNVISNPGVIETSKQLRWVYEKFGFTSKDNFLIALGVVSFCILLLSNLSRGATTRALIRFTWLKHYAISRRLLSQYLYEPYAFFLNRNSSELTAHLLTEVARVVSGVLMPFIFLISRSLLAVMILALLIIVDPLVSIFVIGAIGGGYVIIYACMKERLSITGQEVVMHNKKMYKVLNESFGGIKDIKLLGKEHVFIGQYSEPARKAIDCYCSQFFIAHFPRYAFEILAFGGLLLIAVYIAVIKKSYHEVIPLVGLYAFSAYRLMPTLQLIFQDITSIRFAQASLKTVYEDYIECLKQEINESAKSVPALPFSQKVEFHDLTFQYPKAPKPVIENLDIVINAKTTVGFVGGTGAGKTTVVDILLGLLWPQEGEIVVDGVKLNMENLRRWQKNIGYVSQSIYLCDSTVAHNIAFGIPENEIDQYAVERAAKLANIHDFIVTELPHGYQTTVGERGVRLSGGQRQRIGIARALYHDPSMLVFDEATNALDGITENTILEAIYNLTHERTIIIIAHRLSTVKECDIIYLLEQGKIVAQGTYQELLKNNQQFREMADKNQKDLKFSQSLADTPG